MVPNISQNGTSFTGAGAYYLHDKPFTNEAGERVNPASDARVAWTDVRNLANTEPQKALIEMWRTADAQALLKQHAGVDARGRKCVAPVKTISLAWHPDETPSPEQMREAADRFLEHMGWSEHQAVYVAHNDTAHPHVHIIINRVHPETGRTIDDFREQVRAQVWAREYERTQGHVRCSERTGKDYDRQMPKSRRGIPNALEKEGRGEEGPFVDASAALDLLDGRERSLIHTLQSEQREAFFATARDEFRAARQSAFHEVRDAFKAEWKTHFADARMIRAQARELAGENASRAFMLARDGKLGPAWAALEGKDNTGGFDPVRYAEQHIKEKAAALAARQAEARREKQKEACARAFTARNERFASIKERQKQERAELRDIAAAYGRGERVDIDRLRVLLTGAPAPTNPSALMADLAKANDNATPIDRPASANDNRDPEAALKRRAVHIAGEHMDRLMASVRMTNNAGMAGVQMDALKLLTKRARHEAERTNRAPVEMSDRAARLAALDDRTPEERAADEARAKNRSRDRGGGRGGGRER